MTTPTDLHSAIAGALYDLMGYLTTLDKPITLGAAEWATPAVDALRDFAAKRGLSLDGPNIDGWAALLEQMEQADHTDLTQMTPGPLRTALEAYHNASSGHYESMSAVVVALLEQAQPVGEVRRGDGGAWSFSCGDYLLALYKLPPGVHPLYAAPAPALPPLTDAERKDAARWRWWRQHHQALCSMYVAREVGLDLREVYVNTEEKMDAVTDAAIERKVRGV